MNKDSINRGILTKGLNLRWLLLLCFPLGYLFTVNAYAADWDYYLLLNIISFLSAWLILFRLRNITAENIIIWIIFLLIFGGYYVKFYFFVRGFILGESILESIVLMGGYAALYASPSLLLDCFTSISLSLLLISISSFYMLSNKRKLIVSLGNYNRNHRWKKRCYTTIYISSCIAFISGFVRWFYKLDLPDAAVILPYKVAGITTVTNTYVASLLLGLALIYAVRADKRQAIRITIFSFFAWGAIHYFLFGSKLFLVLPVLWIILIGLWEKRALIKMRYVVGYGSVFVILYPFLNLIRTARREVPGDSIFLYISESLKSGAGTGPFTDSLSSLTLGLFGLMSRIVGLDSLMILTALKPGFDDIGISSIFGGTAENIITNYTLGWRNRGTGIAQSLIGQAYFHTGNIILTAVFVALWTIFTHQVANRLYKVNSSFSQILWVTWIASVIQWTSDGFTAAKLYIFLIAAIPIYLIIYFTESKIIYLNSKKTASLK